MHPHPARMPRASALVVSAVLALPCLPGPAASAADTERRVTLRGADVGAPVSPVVLDVDLRDLPVAEPWQPGDRIKEIPRRSAPVDREDAAPSQPGGPDPLLALQNTAPSAFDPDFATPLVLVPGQGFTGVNPADPSGDVGPSHYIQAINGATGTNVTVYDKNGVLLAGPVVLAAVLGATGNCAAGHGDPVVLYDSLAGRWLVSEFSAAGNQLCVYVSRTSDPISGGWLNYAFATPNFPDYPKYGVWPDAYYVGTNESTSTGAVTPALYALDRARMLAGLPAGFQRFTAPSLTGFGFQMLTPADHDGATPPPAGAPGLFIRHRDSEAHGAPGAADTLQLFEFRVNWTTPAASTLTGPISITLAEFDSALCGLTSFSCFPQPGSTVRLDPLREVVMFRAQHRNRGTFRSLVGNFVTDVNGADRGGIRWFELRQTGTGPWTLFMEGTHAPDEHSRWMGSAALDKLGNLALAYGGASATVSPSLGFAGRLAGDPAGTLAQGESVIIFGAASNASNRWGDYFELVVDPMNDCTFWFTGAFSPTATWATQIAAFKFASCN